MMKAHIKLGCAIVIATVLAVSYGCDSAALASEAPLQLNCSERYWYPFIYNHEDQVKGIFYDMVTKAAENIQIKSSVTAVPFRRALVNAQKGRIDGIIAIGYNHQYAEVVDYPPEAEIDKESPWRLLQVDHVVVSVAQDPYEFLGDIKMLPKPVRLLHGSPIIEDLRKAGIVPQEVREDMQNFLKLIRDANGVIITTSVAAEMMFRDSRFQGKIKIHALPVASHSYYLVFSKQSSVTKDIRLKLWKEIMRLRDDYIFMLQLFSQY